MDDTVKEVLNEMLIARGYRNITEEKDCLICDETVIPLKVFPKLNIAKSVLSSIKFAQTKGKESVILVTVKPSTSSDVSSKLETGFNMRIEIFCVDDLQFNITKHALVPKHLLLKKSDIPKAEKMNLQVLSTEDPIARFYGFEKGNIVLVYRKNTSDPTLPAFVTYKIVK